MLMLPAFSLVLLIIKSSADISSVGLFDLGKKLFPKPSSPCAKCAYPLDSFVIVPLYIFAFELLTSSIVFKFSSDEEGLTLPVA